MMCIRPVRLDDQDAVLKLAKEAGIGMTSLPPDEEVLLGKILRSVKSFDGKPDKPGEEQFLFVLEDSETGEVVGTTGIKAHVGLSQPFYSYKLTTLTQHSSVIDVYSRHQILQVTNDLTGATEIGSLFLRRDYRPKKLGKWLSRCRFLFMANFPELFDTQVIAEMRGVNDRSQHAPFYDSIAKHFFMLDFAKADYINATEGNQFIADLMPKYPIYVSLLPDAAQEAIGAPHSSSLPAKKLLEREGFRHHGYVDVFDAGPTLQVAREDIVSVKDSVMRKVIISESERNVNDATLDTAKNAPLYMLSTMSFSRWRSCLCSVIAQGCDTVEISRKTAETLQVEQGDMVRMIAY